MEKMISDDDSYIYGRYKTAPGIRLETVGGCSRRSGRVWLTLARQVWCENAPDGVYRNIAHTEQGAPLLVSDRDEDMLRRISVSHTSGMFVVASLPAAEHDCGLDVFSPQTALGVDVESDSRTQVLGVRERFLNTGELDMVADGSVVANITAWTCKEAMLKLSMNTGADIRRDLVITELPQPVAAAAGGDVVGFTPGKGRVVLPDGVALDVELHTMRLFGRYICTLACGPDTLRFKSIKNKTI